MHLQKLVTVLKSFDEQKLKRFAEFTASPYFHLPPAAALLLKRLVPLYPQFAETQMQPQKLGRRDQTLSTLAKQGYNGSLLLDAAYRFMAIEDFEKNTSVVKRHRLQALKSLELNDEFAIQFKKEMQLLAQESGQNFETFYEKHLLVEISMNGFKAKLKRNPQNDIIPVIDTLDVFYALKKLRYLCEAVNRKQFFGAALKEQEQYFPMLLKMLEPYTHRQHPYVYVFVHVFKMLTADNYEDSELPYLTIKKYYTDYSGKLPGSIAEGVNFAFGHCHRWYNEGNSNAGNEYLWWVDYKMKNDLLLEDGKLLPITYRNMITIAVANKIKPEYIDRIINIYSGYLPDEHAETYTAFAKGLYHYAIKQYKKAAVFFIQAQAKEEVIFNSLIRRWQWSCLYESDHDDTGTLLAQLDSFEKYLQRNRKEMQHVIKSFELFVRYAMQLLKSITTGQTIIAITALHNEKHFLGKPWFEEQFVSKNKKGLYQKVEKF